MTDLKLHVHITPPQGAAEPLATTMPPEVRAESVQVCMSTNTSIYIHIYARTL
jgi:hypothetical protein